MERQIVNGVSGTMLKTPAQTIKGAFETILKIYSTSGRNDKAALVKDNKDNQCLLKLFQLGMDEYLTYGISEKSFEKFMDKSELYKKPNQLCDLSSDDDYYSFDKYVEFTDKLIPFLLDTQSPSTAVLNELEAFFENLNVLERYFYYRVIIKNFSIGIGPKSINKAVDKLLIKQYTPMLADSGIEKFAKWKWAENEKKEYFTDTKINGLRLSIFININSNEIEIKTRSGRRFHKLEEYLMLNWIGGQTATRAIKIVRDKQELLYKSMNVELSKTDKIVIDCELQHEDKTWESSISVINLNEIDIYNHTSEVPMFYLHVFDITTSIPFEPENFGKRTKTLPFSERRKILESFMVTMNGELIKSDRLFTLTDCKLLDDLGDVENLAKKYIENGYEGAVVKKPDSMYWCGRGPEWLKIKDIVTYDGTIEEIMPGESSGKYYDTTGKIKVKAVIDDKEITGTCGSGFKDVDRDYLWNNQEISIGRTVEFTILGKTVKDNFQSGIFKGFRIDK